MDETENDDEKNTAQPEADEPQTARPVRNKQNVKTFSYQTLVTDEGTVVVLTAYESRAEGFKGKYETTEQSETRLNFRGDDLTGIQVRQERDTRITTLGRREKSTVERIWEYDVPNELKVFNTDRTTDEAGQALRDDAGFRRITVGGFDPKAVRALVAAFQDSRISAAGLISVLHNYLPRELGI